MRKTCYIGTKKFFTKQETRAYIRSLREKDSLTTFESLSLQAFFRVKNPVRIERNTLLGQNELWAGNIRLNSKHTVDFAFIKSDYAEKRVLRAHAIERARNLVHFEGSARHKHLQNNRFCVHCGATTNLEADHIKTSFIQLWIDFGEPPEIGFDELAWQKFHDERACFQTLCRCCHKKETQARKSNNMPQACDLVPAFQHDNQETVTQGLVACAS